MYVFGLAFFSKDCLSTHVVKVINMSEEVYSRLFGKTRRCLGIRERCNKFDPLQVSKASNPLSFKAL